MRQSQLLEQHRSILRLFVIAIALAFAFRSDAAAQQITAPLKSIRVNGITLHYVDQGNGPAVVFVHGAMEDYRAWSAQFAPLAKHFRVIAYSRRYNYPNHNTMRSDSHSALIDAEDLAALIRKLKLGPVRVVGHSYGAYTSMFLTLKHPELVRSLVLSEPPIMKWLNDTPEGKPLLNDFMTNMWVPCAVAFRQHEPEKALQITVDWFGVHESPTNGHSATYADLPADARNFLMQDIGEWQALTTSRDAFPALTRDQVRQIHKPVLLLSGSRSVPALKLIAAELARTLPSVNFVVLDGATHEMWSEVPQQLTHRIEPFLLEH
jgi:pimeloyl-ACP methyl ester carboxylesterase